MWAGRIVADRANEEPGSLEDQDASPWTSTCLWERFTIAWDDQVSGTSSKSPPPPPNTHTYTA